MTKSKDRTRSTPGRKPRPRTYLGAKRRFFAIVRSVTHLRQEVEGLTTALHPQPIEEILDRPLDLTPDTHLLGLIHLFATDLARACVNLEENRHVWTTENVPHLIDVLGDFLRQRAGARIREILLEIAQGLGVPWRQDLEFEVWRALSEGDASKTLDLSAYEAELRGLTAIHPDWWQWNRRRNRLELVWVEVWEEAYADWEERLS